MIGWEKRVLLRHYLAQGVTKAVIAERLGINRRTINHWISKGDLDRDVDATVPRYGPRPAVPTKLDPFKPIIETRLKALPELSAVRLLEEIRAAGYTGGYTQLKEYVRKIRPRETEAVVRFETPPGHQAQVDFADFRLPWGKRYALLVVLGYSRLLWLRFFARKDMAALLAGLEQAFAFFGGVPRELLFDQMRSVITNDERLDGRRLVHNAEFLRFSAHWSFTPRACRPYRAKTKGKVGRPVSYVRGNFFYGREFLNDADLQMALRAWVVEGIEPPPSRYPRLSDGTLVPADEVRFPNIPGVRYTAQYNHKFMNDFSVLPPRHVPGAEYGVLVPQVDEDGNDMAGVRSASLRTATATFTGWNPRAEGYMEGFTCAIDGSYFPFATKGAGRGDDPRPSLEERYGTHAGYVEAFREGAAELLQEGFLLQEDYDRLVAEAEQMDLGLPAERSGLRSSKDAEGATPSSKTSSGVTGNRDARGSATSGASVCCRWGARDETPSSRRTNRRGLPAPARRDGFDVGSSVGTPGFEPGTPCKKAEGVGFEPTWACTRRFSRPVH